MYKDTEFVAIGKGIKYIMRVYKNTFILYEDGSLVENNMRTIANNVSRFDIFGYFPCYIDNNDTLRNCSNLPLIENVDKIISMCGNNYAIDKNKTLWAYGENRHNQLGLGHYNPINTFVRVMENVEQVECLIYITFILDTNGILWCSGETFSQVFIGVRSVKCIINSCYIITKDDILYKYGDDDDGELPKTLKH
jgi:hypothetical protein